MFVIAAAMCFILQPLDGSAPIVSDPVECAVATAPASTYKIPHAVIALETGVIKDTEQVAKWDGTNYPYDAWERDHTIESAMQSSVYWFFQRTAKAIGAERMKADLRKLDYAEDTFDGEIRTFWTNGDLVVTPHEQVRFLQRLFTDQLPIRPETAAIVKQILVVPKGKINSASGPHPFPLKWKDVTRMRAKTGNATVDGERVSWLVGHIEAGDHQYVFASRVRERGPLPATAGAEHALRMLNRVTVGRASARLERRTEARFGTTG